MSFEITGIRIPDSKMSREATEFIRDTESDLLFNHSSRVYYWGGACRSAAWTQPRQGIVIHRLYVS